MGPSRRTWPCSFRGWLRRSLSRSARVGTPGAAGRGAESKHAPWPGGAGAPSTPWRRGRCRRPRPVGRHGTPDETQTPGPDATRVRRGRRPQLRGRQCGGQTERHPHQPERGVTCTPTQRRLSNKVPGKRRGQAPARGARGAHGAHRERRSARRVRYVTRKDGRYLYAIPLTSLNQH